MPSKLEPYFHNGLLYFPQNTIDVLVAIGLDWRIARTAIRGVRLDDHSTLDEIHASIRAALTMLEPDSPLHQILASEDTWFMLTGLPRG